VAGNAKNFRLGVANSADTGIGGFMSESASGLASGASATVKNLVSSSFSQAQDYATTTRTSALAALDSLNAIVMHPSIDDDVTVVFDYSDTEIDVGAHGPVPEKPIIDTTFNFTRPVLGEMKNLPEFSYLTSDIDTARQQFITRIIELMTDGATGLDAEAEAAIWDRMRSRQESENLRQYTEAEQYFSARGYVLPPGALAGRLQEIAIEIARNNTYMNNDITVEQAKLAQTNFQFVMERGAAALIEMMKASISSVIEFNKGTIEAFSADVERYKQEIVEMISEIESQTKIYMAEADVYKTTAMVESADIEAKININKMRLEEAIAKSNVNLKEAEIELDAATKVFNLQVEAMKANAQVHAQIAASALSGVNASASMGFSGGASMSENDGYSHTWDQTAGVERLSTSRHLSA
jgi:hypothetical protein